MNRAIRATLLLMWALWIGPGWVSAQTVPPSKHVLIVFGENAGYSSTYGSMPYLDSLAAKYGLATNYVADTHPSIGNYLVWASGQVLTNDDGYSGTFSVDNIALDVQNASLTWKDYVEDIDSSCPGLTSGGYAEKHDPLSYFTNINQSNRVCFNQFATDLKNNALPNLSFLSPNLCDDAHDCSLSTFDNWLQTEIAPLLASSYFQSGGDGLLVITFDEGSGSGSNSTSGIESGTWTGDQVETVVISPLAKSGYKSSNSYHHESILRLFEEALGLTAFPGASSNPNGALTAPINMSDFFNGTTSSTTVTLSPNSLGFGNQTVGTTSSAQALTLKNGTTSSVSISSIGITGTNSSQFAQTNNCGSSLASGASCAINVTFKPTATGNFSASVSVSDSATGSPQTTSLTGTGVTATATVSPTSLSFGNQTVGTTSAAQSSTLTNNGSTTLTINSLQITGDFAFAGSGTCGSTLATGASCTIIVVFTPTTTGTRTGTVSVNDTATNSPQTISLSGSGVSSSGGGGGGTTTDYYVSTSGSDSTGNGSSSSPWATIGYASTKVGPGAKVHVAAGTYAGDILTSVSGTSSAPITYVSDTPYAAQIVNSSYNGSLNQSVWDNEGSYVIIQGFDISGNAYQGIGNGGSNVTIQGNHVHNVVPADCNGNGGAGIDDHGAQSDDTGNTVNDVGNFSLGTCTYVHGIYADRSGGHISNNLIYHNWSNGIQLWGAPNGITISGNTVFNNGNDGLVLGSDTSTADSMVVTDNIFVKNANYGFDEQGTTGPSNQYNNNLSYGNTNGPYHLQTGTASATVEADPLFVNYQPDGGDDHLTSSSPAINAGTSQGASNHDFSGNVRPQTRSTGNGWDIGAYEYLATTPGPVPLSVSPTTITFASQTVGTTAAARAVTLKNSNSSSVTVSSIAISGTDGGDFAETNNCGSSLAANSSCTVNVAFTPSASGTRAATLTVADNASSSPHTVPLTGTGVNPVPILSPTGLNFTGQVVGATSGAQTVTLTNPGGTALSITSVAVSGDFLESNTCGNSVAAGGSCTVSITFKPTAGGTRAGTLTVTDNASNSPQTVALSGDGQDFSLATSASSQSVSAGGVATYTLQVSPMGGFKQTVNFSCSGAPAQATCSLTPASVSLDGSGKASLKLTVTTTASSTAGLRNSGRPLSNPPASGLLLGFWTALLGVVGLGLAQVSSNVQKVRFRLAAPLVAVILCVAFWAGCGGTSMTGRSAPGTPQGTYTLTIEAKSGSVSHSTAVQLVVH